MFKRKTVENKKGITSNSFTNLLTQAKFINKNLSKLDFIGGAMVTRATLNGRVYFCNVSPSLSEIDDIDTVTNKIDLVDMISLQTGNDSVDIYQNRYDSHIITDSYIEINFNNGQTRRLNY